MMNYFINVLLMLELKPVFEYQLLFEDLQYLTLLKPSTTKSAHDVFVDWNMKTYFIGGYSQMLDDYKLNSALNSFFDRLKCVFA